MNPVEVPLLFPCFPRKDWEDDVHLEMAAMAKVLEENEAGEFVSLFKEHGYKTFKDAWTAMPLFIRDGMFSPENGARIRKLLNDFDTKTADFQGSATSSLRCASVMTYLATPSPKLSSDIRQEWRVGNLPPAFIPEFRKALTRLCGRYALFTDRLKFNKEKQIVDFFKTFAEVAHALLRKTCIFDRNVSGLVNIKGDEIDGKRKLGLALARSGIVNMLMKDWLPSLTYKKSKLPKNIPRKIAAAWGEVQPDQVAIQMCCGVLVNDDFAIEYEPEDFACLYSAGSDTGIDEEFVKRLLWLSPFDIVTIPIDIPDKTQEDDEDEMEYDDMSSQNESN